MTDIKLDLPRRRLPFGLFGAAAGGLLLLVGVLWYAMTVYVAPDEFAIRQVYLGPSQGVSKTVVGPGLQLVIPGYERLHVLPRDLQMLDMNDEPSPPGEDRLAGPPLVIQTSEGFKVTVDVTVLYRVVDPYTVITEIGPGRLYESKIVIRYADKIMRETLGQLNAEDFYSDEIRIAKAEDARKAMQRDLEQFGIQVWAVLIRDYTYDERYQAAIEERKVQDQRVFKAKAEGLAATRSAEKERVIAEGDATIGVALEGGKAEVRKIAAEADLYHRTRVAQGELLVALAAAEGTRLENEALRQPGAGAIVGLEMAKALDGTQVIIVSTTGPGAMNPLDLDSLLKGW